MTSTTLAYASFLDPYLAIAFAGRQIFPGKEIYYPPGLPIRLQCPGQLFIESSPSNWLMAPDKCCASIRLDLSSLDSMRIVYSTCCLTDHCWTLVMIRLE